LHVMHNRSPIGIFDSGYGGLTVFKAIAAQMPDYDYIYLGDNARTPYGNRSFETVYDYTLQCVKRLFASGCPLVILACNTASAKALRNIQQIDLPTLGAEKRVLGVIRPTAEVIGNYTLSGHIGVLGTRGTVNSQSYVIEIHKFFPQLQVHQLACPMWVPLIENGLYMTEGADYFIQRDIDTLLSAHPQIDVVLLACTHYPVLEKKIKQHLPRHIMVVAQGEIVAQSLYDYLVRHPEMDALLTQNGSKTCFTTDDATDFNNHAPVFFGSEIVAEHIDI
jgi:glutamate racemase